MSLRVRELVDPSREELLAASPQLDPDGVELLVADPREGRDARPTLEAAEGVVAGLLLVPLHRDDDGMFVYLELGLVATPESLLVIRKTGPHGQVPATAVRPEPSAPTIGLAVHGIVDGVVDGYLDLVDALFHEIDELEDLLDQAPATHVQRRLTSLRHELLLARRNASAMRSAVRQVVDGRIEVGDEQLFPREVEREFAETYDTLVRVTEELDVAHDLLASVRDHLQARVSEAQNEVVRKLTVVASLVLVPTLITGFFGQNFAGAFDDRFWTLRVSVGLIVLTTVAQLAFFRWRRWI